jgi:hypothetical protein
MTLLLILCLWIFIKFQLPFKRSGILWHWNFLKTIFWKGFLFIIWQLHCCVQHQEYLWNCSNVLLHWCFHHGIFNDELLSSSCVHDQPVSRKLCIFLEYLIYWKEGNESNFTGWICNAFALHAIHMLLNHEFLFLKYFLCFLVCIINQLNLVVYMSFFQF